MLLNVPEGQRLISKAKSRWCSFVFSNETCLAGAEWGRC